MALIKHRPRIRLLLVPELRPGESFVATVVVDARRPAPIEYIDVDLIGTEERSVHSQYNLVRRRHICTLRARVESRCTLPAGRSEFRCRFSLPEGAPPSYSGQAVQITYLMNVHAAIPWWPDARASFEVNVGIGRAVEPPSARPILFSSRPEGPSASEPHVEGSLSSDALVPGGLVTGRIALGNVEYTRYAGVRLALVGIEGVDIGGRRSESEAHRYEIRLAVERWVEGKQYEFRMRLPAYVPPSFSEPSRWELQWYFECRAHIRWGQDMTLRVPVKLISRRLQSALRSRQAPPTVGSRRVNAIWREVAQGSGLTLDGGRIHGSVAGTELAIEREHRGRGGVYLVARLGYRPLHLDLDIVPVDRVVVPPRGSLRAERPAMGMRRSSGGDLQLGVRRWDRDHRVGCREPEQFAALTGVLGHPLARFRSVIMDDSGAVLELRNAGATQSRLQAFVTDVVEFARAIEAARQAIPPPRLMSDDVASWSALAQALDGELEVARMAVEGSLAGNLAAVRTEWTEVGEPVHTVLDVHPPRTIDEVHRVVRVAGEPPGSPVRSAPPDNRTAGPPGSIDRTAGPPGSIDRTAGPPHSIDRTVGPPGSIDRTAGPPGSIDRTIHDGQRSEAEAPGSSHRPDRGSAAFDRPDSPDSPDDRAPPLIDQFDSPSPAATRALRDAVAVEITAESMTITVPAPAHDGKALLTRLRAMIEWARELGIDAGPYR